MRAGRALGHTSAMLNHAVAERLALHPTSWECLTLLFEYGPLSAGRLAELTGLTSGAVTGLVDRLKAAGYVRRRPDPADRRRVIVELVPAALADVLPLFDPMLADLQERHGHYTDEQLQSMASCLRDSAEIIAGHARRIRRETAEHRRTDGGE